VIKKKIPGILAWAWECDFGLCAWAEPSAARLKKGGRPSPEAQPVRVRIIKESEFQALLLEAKK
jgi:hypothetical protein